MLISSFKNQFPFILLSEWGVKDSFDLTIVMMINDSVFIFTLQLTKMAQGTESDGDIGCRLNHTVTNTSTFLTATGNTITTPSVARNTAVTTHTATRNTVTTHTATSSTFITQTAASNISTAQTAANSDTLTQGVHSAVTGQWKSAFVSFLWIVYPCDILINLKSHIKCNKSWYMFSQEIQRHLYRMVDNMIQEEHSVKSVFKCALCSSYLFINWLIFIGTDAVDVEALLTEGLFKRLFCIGLYWRIMWSKPSRILWYFMLI